MRRAQQKTQVKEVFQDIFRPTDKRVISYRHLLPGNEPYQSLFSSSSASSSSTCASTSSSSLYSYSYSSSTSSSEDEAEDVDETYHSECFENAQLRTGKNRTVINLTSFLVRLAPLRLPFNHPILGIDQSFYKSRVLKERVGGKVS